MSLSLPRLLASIPSTSKPILLKPSKWPSNSFYLVTRQDLQFTSSASSSPSTTTATPVDGSSSTSIGEQDIRQERLKVKGRVWGLKFWQGRPYTRQSPKISDPKIPQSTSQQWVTVDYSSLPSEIQASVKEGKKLVEQRRKERKEVLKRS
ncbi:uncharacterized protein IL334_003804 [Kwoniella shivajii]|uniref:Uncharacterized protein n=1 Tax=Kwoniella shivajii TaxID=564305 RepID=A0ABZ1CYX8_9TREE|nr:hypothetical protein IL334_003804 [Kwoniella shivajii]